MSRDEIIRCRPSLPIDTVRGVLDTLDRLGGALTSYGHPFTFDQRAGYEAATKALVRVIHRQRTLMAPHEPLLRHFQYAHLPEPLRNVSEAFCELATDVCLNISSRPERTVALRKLLEARDAAVRAMKEQDDDELCGEAVSGPEPVHAEGPAEPARDQSPGPNRVGPSLDPACVSGKAAAQWGAGLGGSKPVPEVEADGFITGRIDRADLQAKIAAYEAEKRARPLDRKD